MSAASRPHLDLTGLTLWRTDDGWLHIAGMDAKDKRIAHCTLLNAADICLHINDRPAPCGNDIPAITWGGVKVTADRHASDTITLAP